MEARPRTVRTHRPRTRRRADGGSSAHGGRAARPPPADSSSCGPSEAGALTRTRLARPALLGLKLLSSSSPPSDILRAGHEARAAHEARRRQRTVGGCRPRTSAALRATAARGLCARETQGQARAPRDRACSVPTCGETTPRCAVRRAARCEMRAAVRAVHVPTVPGTGRVACWAAAKGGLRAAFRRRPARLVTQMCPTYTPRAGVLGDGGCGAGGGSEAAVAVSVAVVAMCGVVVLFACGFVIELFACGFMFDRVVCLLLHRRLLPLRGGLAVTRWCGRRWTLGVFLGRKPSGGLIGLSTRRRSVAFGPDRVGTLNRLGG